MSPLAFTILGPTELVNIISIYGLNTMDGIETGVESTCTRVIYCFVLFFVRPETFMLLFSEHLVSNIYQN